MLIPRTVAVAAYGAVIIGALQSQRTEYTLDLLGATPGITRGTPARTTNPTDFIGKVSVEALLHSLACQLQHLLSNRDFQSLEIQVGDRLAPHQGLNLLNDVEGQ